MLKNKEINLDLPVDAYDAEGNPRKKGSESILEEDSTKVSQTKENEENLDEKDEVKVQEKKEEEPTEEQRVPYSRFDKIRREKEEAIARAEELEKALSERQNYQPRYAEVELDPYEEAYARDIKRLYGDNEVSNEIINLNLRHQRMIEERAERKALEAIERKNYEETQAITQNENIIEQRLERLSDKLGRTLSEKEEEALLEIVDEYTPTGDDGRYAGEILSFEKAWEIHELRESQRAQSSKRSRSAATMAASSRSQGEPNGAETERDKNFDPRNWNSLYKRIGGN